MGSCLSASYSDEIVDILATAKVITIDGALREYSVPTKVSDVLDEKHTTSFLCSSDDLYLDRDIPALRSHDWAEIGQIYFILPQSMLDRPLKGQDMAALAVKACSALAGTLQQRSGSRRNKQGIQVMPVSDFGEKLDQSCKFNSDLSKPEQTGNKVFQKSGTKLGGRTSVKGQHNMSRLVAIQEGAE